MSQATQYLISKKQLAYIFSSDEASGAINRSADGTVFSVQLDDPIALPRGAFDCTLDVVSMRAWNNVPNITAALGNNKFRVITGGSNYDVTITDGLYDTNSLNDFIQNELVNQGLDREIISLSANFATEQVIIGFGAVGVQVDFAIPDSVRTVLGFDARLSPPAPSTVVGQTDSGDKTAELNNVENFLIKSDIVNANIPVNNSFDQTIAYLPILSPPGSQITNEPINPIRIDASTLKNGGRNFFTFRLTDQTGKPADTGEAFGLTIVIRWKEFQTRVFNY